MTLATTHCLRCGTEVRQARPWRQVPSMCPACAFGQRQAAKGTAHGGVTRQHRSVAGELLLLQLRGLQVEGLVAEYRWHPTRRWRFDVAWPAVKLAVEVDGGGWINGRHSRGSGVEADCEKVSTAVCDGWRVLRVTPRQVRSGQAAQWVLEALGHTSVGDRREAS